MRSGGRSSHRNNTGSCAGTGRNAPLRAPTMTARYRATTAAPVAGSSCSVRIRNTIPARAGPAIINRSIRGTSAPNLTTAFSCAEPRCIAPVAGAISAMCLRTARHQRGCGTASTRLRSLSNQGNPARTTATRRDRDQRCPGLARLSEEQLGLVGAQPGDRGVLLVEVPLKHEMDAARAARNRRVLAMRENPGQYRPLREATEQSGLHLGFERSRMADATSGHRQSGL